MLSDLMGMTLKAQVIKRNIHKWDYMKFKCRTAKEVIGRVKSHPTD